MPSSGKIVFALSVLAIALAVGLGAWWLVPGGGGPSVTGEALVGGPFEMTDHNGKRVSEKDFLGRYMLAFFGFTYCPDVCPSELQTMSAALDRMGPEAEKIQPVFVTVDPARDTPEAMKAYVANFHPRLIGLTGSEEDVARMARAYRIYYGRAKGYEEAKDYLMDHSAILYLMGPDGKFVKHFSYTTDAAALADGLKLAVSR